MGSSTIFNGVARHTPEKGTLSSSARSNMAFGTSCDTWDEPFGGLQSPGFVGVTMPNMTVHSVVLSLLLGNHLASVTAR